MLMNPWLPGTGSGGTAEVSGGAPDRRLVGVGGHDMTSRLARILGRLGSLDHVGSVNLHHGLRPSIVGSSLFVGRCCYTVLTAAFEADSDLGKCCRGFFQSWCDAGSNCRYGNFGCPQAALAAKAYAPADIQRQGDCIVFASG